MNSDKKSREIHLKNGKCHYFQDIIDINDLNPDNISMYERSH